MFRREDKKKLIEKIEKKKKKLSLASMIPKPNHRIQKKKTLYWPSSSPLVSSNHHISYSIFNQTKQIHISISFLSQTKISDGPTSKPSIATSICDPYFFLSPQLQQRSNNNKKLNITSHTKPVSPPPSSSATYGCQPPC
jgi:hypothetical protein